MDTHDVDRYFELFERHFNDLEHIFLNYLPENTGELAQYFRQLNEVNEMEMVLARARTAVFNLQSQSREPMPQKATDAVTAVTALETAVNFYDAQIITGLSLPSLPPVLRNLGSALFKQLRAVWKQVKKLVKGLLQTIVNQLVSLLTQISQPNALAIGLDVAIKSPIVQSNVYLELSYDLTGTQAGGGTP